MMNESISVLTDAGELVATPFAGGISVDINLPDGKGSGQLAFIEAAPEGLRDDYPTPVHVFTYDGLDSTGPSHGRASRRGCHDARSREGRGGTQWRRYGI
ncbi:MAG: hypothetical protein ACLT98_00555 [Eggerthellaceae bacterium]